MTESIKKDNQLLRLIWTALFLAIGLLLPMLFHAVPGGGAVFLPMHLPVLLCGFLCGPYYGFLCGVMTPLLSSILTGMPAFMPTGVSMIFELGTYGFLAGFCYKKWHRLFFSLITAMLIGRVVKGIVMLALLGFAGKPYTMDLFIASSFITALPGIVIQLVLIPVLVKACEKVLENRKNGHI